MKHLTHATTVALTPHCTNHCKAKHVTTPSDPSLVRSLAILFPDWPMFVCVIAVILMKIVGIFRSSKEDANAFIFLTG